MEGRSKPEAVYIHGGACQASPQLCGMQGNQALACGDYYDAAEALNSVAIKPLRTGMRTALLEAPGRVYKRRSSAASKGDIKRHRTSESTSEKGIVQSESS